MDAVAPLGINENEVLGVLPIDVQFAKFTVVRLHSKSGKCRLLKTLTLSCDLDILHQQGILLEPANCNRRRRKWCEREQKRGKRPGIHARLKANPSRLAATTSWMRYIC